MKEPKYEPLKMGSKKFADSYGKKMKRYLKNKHKCKYCGERDFSETGTCGRCFNLQNGI